MINSICYDYLIPLTVGYITKASTYTTTEAKGCIKEVSKTVGCKWDM